VGPKVGLDAVDRSNFVALAGIRPAIPLTPSLSLVCIPLTLPWSTARNLLPINAAAHTSTLFGVFIVRACVCGIMSDALSLLGV
jgi:hypothetical protein